MCCIFRFSCMETIWTACTSWSCLRFCRLSWVACSLLTTWAPGPERCLTTRMTRRRTTAPNPTPCLSKTWRKTCPPKLWRGLLLDVLAFQCIHLCISLFYISLVECFSSINFLLSIIYICNTIYKYIKVASIFIFSGFIFIFVFCIFSLWFWHFYWLCFFYISLFSLIYFYFIF